MFKIVKSGVSYVAGLSASFATSYLLTSIADMATTAGPKVHPAVRGAVVVGTVAIASVVGTVVADKTEKELDEIEAILKEIRTSTEEIVSNANKYYPVGYNKYCKNK